MSESASRQSALFAALAATVVILAATPADAQQKEPTAPALEAEPMVTYPGTSYERGVEYQLPSDYGDSWNIDQQPAHEVTVDTFRLDTHEVTVREFALYLTHAAGEYHYHDDQPIDRVEQGYLPAEGTAEEPIRQVTWRAARDYCRWAGKRLPTEAEWEFAARGAEEFTYPWGDEGPSCERANYFTGRTFCEGKPVEVGSHPDGEFLLGTQDLAGNVAEWTADWYGDYPEQPPSEPLDNPTGPDEGTYRVVRGGSYLSNSNYLRSVARRAVLPDRHSEAIGFRCAISEEAVSEVDGSHRGELELPADDNREERERFPGTPAESAEIVAEGLEDPGAIVGFDGNFYIVDRGGEAVAEFAPESGETTTIVEDLEGVRQLTAGGDRLYATGGESGTIYEIAPGMPASEFATADEAVGPVAVRDGRLFVGTASGVSSFDLDSGDETVLVDGLSNVTHVATSPSTLVYSADGGGNTSNFEFGSVPIDGGNKTVFATGEDVGGQMVVSGLDYAASSDQFYYVLRRQGFPRHGYLGQNDGSTEELELLTHTPPNPGALEFAADTVFWASSRNVAALAPGDDDTFRFPAKWTQIGDLHADDERVIWTDVHTGRIYQVVHASSE